MVVVVGYPLGHGLGHQWGEATRVALTAVTLVAWVAWFACCAQLTRSVVAQVRRGQATASVGAVLTERVAARIAAGVLSMIAVAAPLFVASEAGASSAGGTTSVVGMQPARVVALHAGAVQSAQVPVSATYVVRAGDSLWSIAGTQLGDAGDWPAIAALNLGRTMPDGLRFVDPGLIRAGWTLLLPGEGGPMVSAAPGPTAPPTAPAVVHPPATPTSTSVRGVSSPAGQATHARPHGDDIVATGLAFPTDAAMVAPPSGPLTAAGAGSLTLPDLSALGIGAIVCAALARRSRRMRMLHQIDSDEPDTASHHTAGAIDADIRLARFSGVPSLHTFEAANYELGRAMDALQGVHSSNVTKIRAVCVGSAGVDFWLGDAGQPAPDGFTLSVDGKAWHAAHDSFTPHGGARPFLPIVLPIGEDQDGTWMLPLTRAGCLPLVGEASGDLWRAARLAQEAWAWAELVVITEDPLVVAREVGLLDDEESPDDLQVLFFGDPASLSDAQRVKVAIVTGSVAAASDVTVLVDRNAASIHPLGRTVQPHLMRTETSASVSELVTFPLRVDTAQPPDRKHAIATRRALQVQAVPVPMPDAGTVVVRLLTATPRLEGLQEELAPNRARRATELVAYLALHVDDDVTSDRLRTRVLGSSDSDAASKTLFNIAAAARRALGSDSEGASLFPPGTRDGIYRVSRDVMVDVHLAASIAARGSATEDPQEAMALLRSALSLVEGEPLTNVLSGYGWWEAEGHGARLAAVLVHAASDLATLAADSGLFDLAQWGLGQARLVDPYSEALSRVGMQVAASAGDADRLRREWRECQRRIDELDPGSSPSPRTERLYGELAQRVLVGVKHPT